MSSEPSEIINQTHQAMPESSHKNNGIDSFLAASSSFLDAIMEVTDWVLSGLIHGPGVSPITEIVNGSKNSRQNLSEVTASSSDGFLLKIVSKVAQVSLTPFLEAA